MKLKSAFPSSPSRACCRPSASPNAADDYARPGWYLGAGGTWAPHWWKAPEDELGSPRQDGEQLRLPRARRLPHQALARGRARVRVAGRLRQQGVRIDDLQAAHARHDGQREVPLPRLEPIPALRALRGRRGHLRDRRSERCRAAGLESTSAGFAARATAGLDFYITKNWLLNVEAGAVIPTNEVKNSNGGDLEELFYVPIQLGVQYRF